MVTHILGIGTLEDSAGPSYVSESDIPHYLPYSSIPSFSHASMHAQPVGTCYLVSPWVMHWDALCLRLKKARGRREANNPLPRKLIRIKACSVGGGPTKIVARQPASAKRRAIFSGDA